MKISIGANAIRVAMVGADSAGKSWAGFAHVPSLQALSKIDESSRVLELVALCNSSRKSAESAGKHYGVNKVYHDIDELVHQDDIDLVSVVVKIPNHYEIVKAALNAGKHVYCEWPVGASFEETQELADLAREKKVVTAVGLQGRNTPALLYIKQLYEDGWLGDIQCIRMTSLTQGKPTRSSLKEYEAELHRGANLMSIIGGHELHYINFCFGKFKEVSARVETRQKELVMEDTGEKVPNKEPDQILVNGLLESDAVVTVHLGSVAFPPKDDDSWKMEIYGSKGRIVATTNGMPQIAPITLMGEQLLDSTDTTDTGDEGLKELEIPQSILEASKDLPPFGPTTNIGRHYKKMVEAIHQNEKFDCDFDTALEACRVLEIIKESSKKHGITIQL